MFKTSKYYIQTIYKHVSNLPAFKHTQSDGREPRDESNYDGNLSTRSLYEVYRTQLVQEADTAHTRRTQHITMCQYSKMYQVSYFSQEQYFRLIKNIFACGAGTSISFSSTTFSPAAQIFQYPSH